MGISIKAVYVCMYVYMYSVCACMCECMCDKFMFFLNEDFINLIIDGFVHVCEAWAHICGLLGPCVSGVRM